MMVQRVAATLVLASLMLILSGCTSTHPSDEKLEQNFRRFESEFEKLVQMSNEDSKVIRIAHDFTRLTDNWQWPRPESEWGISRKRWDEYRALFGRLGIDAGLSRAESRDGTIFLTASALGLSVSGSEKGYVYSTKQPSPLLKSLDRPGVEVKSLQPIFRHLKGNWYLYYMWDD